MGFNISTMLLPSTNRMSNGQNSGSPAKCQKNYQDSVPPYLHLAVPPYLFLDRDLVSIYIHEDICIFIGTHALHVYVHIYECGMKDCACMCI